MVKKLRTNLKRLRKGDANIGLIMLAFGAILAVAIYLYAKNAGDGINNTVNSTNSGLASVNNKLESNNIPAGLK